MQTGAGDGIMSISAVHAENSGSSSMFSFSEALFIADLHRFLERLRIQIYNSEKQSYSNAFCKKERVYG